MQFLTDIPIVIVLIVFLTSIIYCYTKYLQTGKNLKNIIEFIKDFKKNDLNYRFKEMDDWMLSNPYVASFWIEFKNTLVFSESVALKTEDTDLKYQNISSTVQNVQTTSDITYFFNEDTLVTSKFNFKMIQSMPTILTGCGPLFTFLNIALAFGKIDFSSQEKTIASVSSFMSSMQAAALVSVIAVGSSLLFIMIEKLMFNKMCKVPTIKIQEILGGLFANISAEKFLYEILRESKVQNNNSINMVASIPENFKSAIDTGLTTNLIPYLENLIYGLNQLNKQLKESLKERKSSDEVDDLF